MKMLPQSYCGLEEEEWEKLFEDITMYMSMLPQQKKMLPESYFGLGEEEWQKLLLHLCGDKKVSLNTTAAQKMLPQSYCGLEEEEWEKLFEDITMYMSMLPQKKKLSQAKISSLSKYIASFILPQKQKVMV